MNDLFAFIDRLDSRSAYTAVSYNEWQLQQTKSKPVNMVIKLKALRHKDKNKSNFIATVQNKTERR